MDEYKAMDAQYNKHIDEAYEASLKATAEEQYWNLMNKNNQLKELYRMVEGLYNMDMDVSFVGNDSHNYSMKLLISEVDGLQNSNTSNTTYLREPSLSKLWYGFKYDLHQLLGERLKDIQSEIEYIELQLNVVKAVIDTNNI